MSTMTKYRAINMYNVVIWEGEAINEYWAWKKFFVESNFPNDYSIHEFIDNGMRMEKIEG